jgi:serine/threonine protein kinase
MHLGVTFCRKDDGYMFYMVTERQDLMSLDDYLKEMKSKIDYKVSLKNYEELYAIIKQIISIVGGICCSNVLIDKTGKVVKLRDFYHSFIENGGHLSQSDASMQTGTVGGYIAESVLP